MNRYGKNSLAMAQTKSQTNQPIELQMYILSVHQLATLSFEIKWSRNFAEILGKSQLNRVKREAVRSVCHEGVIPVEDSAGAVPIPK